MSVQREVLAPEVRTFFHCAISARDGRRCFYCRRNFRRRPMRRKTLDHYIPYRLWPAWDIDNLVLACEGCNVTKDDLLPWPLVWLLLAVFQQSEWELTA
jgi:5-methylcytosine-specific restriction endonuclease McrA